MGIETGSQEQAGHQQVLGSIEKACLMHKIENDKVNDISLWPLLSYALPTYAHVGTCTQTCVPCAHIWQKRNLVKLDSGFEVFFFAYTAIDDRCSHIKETLSHKDFT